MGSVINGITDAVGITNHSGSAAVQAQTDAASAANQTQWNMYNQTRSDLQPYNQAGTQALNTLQGSLGSLTKSYNPSDLQNDPGYQFQMKQGLNALQNSAAARGNLNSGATLKAITQYGQNYAQNAYQNALTNYNNDRSMKYNMLSGLVTTGQNAAAQTGSAGTNLANQVSANQVGIGNAQASSIIGQQNRFTNALQQGAQAAAAAKAK